LPITSATRFSARASPPGANTTSAISKTTTHRMAPSEIWDICTFSIRADADEAEQQKFPVAS
jgi:hypothetical protein